VRVRVPATSANLGPGFDALGLALNLHDEVTVRVVSSPGTRVHITGEGAGELPEDESHLVVRCALAAFERLGGRPAGLEFRCVNRIPQARGLGSSSAAIVAGILAARALVAGGDEGTDDEGLDDEGLEDEEVLRLANEIEGHPDNVAPCLLGGITIAWVGPDGARAVRLAPAQGVHPLVLVPAERGLTEQARAALPETVPHVDAARNAGRAALLVHSLTAAPELLWPATEDWLHQRYRAAATPATYALVTSLREAGIPAVVSGAGPSVLAFSGFGEISITTGWQLLDLGVDVQGAVVEVDSQHAERGPVAAGRAS
jgi:homoserine kinase